MASRRPGMRLAIPDGNVSRVPGAEAGPGTIVMSKVATWLLEKAEEARRRALRAAPDVRIDPRTGDPDLTSEDGRLVLAAVKARGLMLREAMLCLRLLSPAAPQDAEALAVFLEDPHDALVVETLRAFEDWRLEAALPAVLALYRTYPTEHTFEAHPLPAPGLGHPDRRRRRPTVVRALRRCLRAITGRSFEGPGELARWLDEAGGGRRSAA